MARMPSRPMLFISLWNKSCGVHREGQQTLLYRSTGGNSLQLKKENEEAENILTLRKQQESVLEPELQLAEE